VTVHMIAENENGESGPEVKKFQLPIKLNFPLIWKNGSFVGAGRNQILKLTVFDDGDWRSEPTVDCTPWYGIQQVACCKSSDEIILITNKQVTKFSFGSKKSQSATFTDKINRIQNLEAMIKNELRKQENVDSHLKRISACYMIRKEMQTSPKIKVAAQLCIESVVLRVSIRFENAIFIPENGHHIYLRIESESLPENKPRLIPFWSTQTPSSKFSFDFVLSAQLWNQQDVRLTFGLAPTADTAALLSLGSYVVDLFHLSKSFILSPLKTDSGKVEILLTRVIFVAEYMIKGSAEEFIGKVIQSLGNRRPGKIWSTVLPMGWKCRVKGRDHQHNAIKGVEFTLLLWALESGEAANLALFRMKAALLRRILPFLCEPVDSVQNDEMWRKMLEHAEQKLANIQDMKSKSSYLREKLDFPSEYTNVEGLQNQMESLLKNVKLELVSNDSDLLLI